MTLRLNGSTSGYTEIDAPAVAGSNTLVLPGGNGTAGQVLSTNGSGSLSWTSDVMLNAGSASSPSLYFSGDTNTGMWSPGADAIALSTSGVKRFEVNGSGNFLLCGATVTNPGAGNASTGLAFEAAASGATVLISRGDNAAFYLNRNNDGSVALFNRSGTGVGNISVTSTATAYNTSSDYRLKENITPLTGAIDRLSQIPVHRFNFKADPTKTVDGFIAHEAQAVVPEAVTGTKDAVDADGNPIYQGIDQSKLVPLLTAALQEAIAKIETLEAKVAALEAQP